MGAAGDLKLVFPYLLFLLINTAQLTLANLKYEQYRKSDYF